MDFEPDLEPATNAQFPRKWMEACFETCALVLGVEETNPGRTSRSRTPARHCAPESGDGSHQRAGRRLVMFGWLSV